METATNSVVGWGAALTNSLSGALADVIAVVPRLLGFVLILIVGWLVASALAALVASLLRAVKFNTLAERSGFSSFVKNMGVNTDASGLIARVTKWFVRLITLVVAFDALGLPAVSAVLRDLLLWLPNLVVALVVLVITGLAANALSDVVRGATAQAGFSNPGTLAGVARVAVWAFGIIVAVNQLGIAQTLVNTLFTALVGALALALGLAFGLGGREAAAQVIEDARRNAQSETPKLGRAAEAAKQQTGGAQSVEGAT